MQSLLILKILIFILFVHFSSPFISQGRVTITISSKNWWGNLCMWFALTYATSLECEKMLADCLTAKLILLLLNKLKWGKRRTVIIMMNNYTSLVFSFENKATGLLLTLFVYWRNHNSFYLESIHYKLTSPLHQFYKQKDKPYQVFTINHKNENGCNSWGTFV